MDSIDGEFCFFDDPEYRRDADSDSLILRAWHAQLWSKELPSGDLLAWRPDAGALTSETPFGQMWVSSDTIATNHANYASRGGARLWGGLDPGEQERFSRAFYRISGFIVFPVHRESLNQLRGRDIRICDRFDLTLECIRQHYVGEAGNPLSPVLEVDRDFFRLFGEGLAGFVEYVKFFHLQDLVADGSIRWLDDFDGEKWDFANPPLPQTDVAYRRYLSNVLEFVDNRSDRIRDWCQGGTPS